MFDYSKDIVLTEAYLSTIDFPESKYYDSRYINVRNVDITRGKMNIKNIIPIALKEQGDRLIEQDFMNINAFIQYESKEAYIFNNAIGRKVKWELFERDNYNKQIEFNINEHQ